jgi:hypothetical protein
VRRAAAFGATLLALAGAHWRFPGGATADGRRVRHRFEPGARPRARLTVADSAGCGTASARFRGAALGVRRQRGGARLPSFTG